MEVKVPPHSREVEQALLGAMLLDREAAEVAMDLAKEEDFYFESHRLIFHIIAELTIAGSPVDSVMVMEALQKAGNLEKVGGATYLSTLANAAPAFAPEHVENYARIVAEKSRLRKVIRVAQEAMKAAYAGDSGAVDKLQAEAMEIEGDCSRVEPVSYREIYSRTVDVLEERFTNMGAITGVPSGYVDLDKMTSGFHRGELTILAGRPSMGKSALARCIAENAAKAGHAVLMVILEDTLVNLMQRAISRVTGINALKLRTGKLDLPEWDKVVSAGVSLPKLPIWCLENMGVTLSGLRTAARKLKREHNLGMVMVDYLQLLEPPRHRENRNLEIADVSKGLKSLAKELDIPVIAVAQLSRGPEARQNKRPMLSDLRESGNIEQDADCVLMLFREDYYNPETDRSGITDVIVAKQRNGPVGTVHLRWDPMRVSFNSLAEGGMWNAS